MTFNLKSYETYSEHWIMCTLQAYIQAINHYITGKKLDEDEISPSYT